MKKEDVLQLLPILNERSISKGELDVVYTEYQNWSRHGLLIDGLEHKKGQQSKLSMKEYLWLRIVDKLIRFGVNYNSIIEIKSKVFAPIVPEIIFNSCFAGLGYSLKLSVSISSCDKMISPILTIGRIIQAPG